MPITIQPTSLRGFRSINEPITQYHWGTYTVAALPTAGVAAGDIAYASNGRKPSEDAAAGTGILVYRDATAWRSVADGTTVAA
jgi:hypothetical protein